MAKHRNRQIETVQEKEHAGPCGAWRRDFCAKYRELLARARDNSYHALADTLASRGEKITCRKGCTHCCHHYVAAPLAHGIVIVDYLYGRKELLKGFIQNYETWRHRGHALSNSIDSTRTRAFSSSLPIRDIITVTRPLSMRYLEMGIPCPFLVNDSCVIYPVRPMPCAGQYSVSPPDWCAPGSREQAVIHQLVPDDEDLLEILRLAGPHLMTHEVTLPILIYRLLTEGVSSVLSSCLQETLVQGHGVEQPGAAVPAAARSVRPGSVI